MNKYFISAMFCFHLWLVGMCISKYLNSMILLTLMAFMLIPVLIIANLLGRLDARNDLKITGVNNE